MTRLFAPFAALIAAGLLVGAAAPIAAQGAAGAVPAGVLGRWVNPKHTAVVDTAPCGNRLCGTVACASPEAIEKAREKGTTQLVGTQLLERLEQKPDKRWRGKVFVPDMQGRFAAIMTPLSNDRIEVKGCILGGLLCKKQVWTRIPANSCEVHLRVKKS